MGELGGNSQCDLQLYVCENCGRIAPIENFTDDCRPGWTHGRLTKVDMASVERLRENGKI